MPTLARHLVALLIAAAATACGAAPAPSPADPTQPPAAEPWADLYVAHFDGAEGFVDRDGKVVVPARYDLAHVFTEGLARVYTAGETRVAGFIDPTGAWAIAPRFRSAKPFSDGRAAVKDPETLDAGYIDRTGVWVIPPRFERAQPFHEGRATVELPGRKGAVIDVDGKIVFRFPPGADIGDPPHFSEGLMPIELPGAVRFVDRDGATVFEGPWKFSRGFSEGRAPVRGADGWAFVDRSGTVVADGFRYAGSFREGLAQVSIEGREGTTFINKAGEVALAVPYDRVANFSEGLARIETEAGIGYIDRSGEVVIAPTWADPQSSASSFRRGRAMVARKGPDGATQRGYIDRTGTVVVEPSR